MNKRYLSLLFACPTLAVFFLCTAFLCFSLERANASAAELSTQNIVDDASPAATLKAIPPEASSIPTPSAGAQNTKISENSISAPPEGNTPDSPAAASITTQGAPAAPPTVPLAAPGIPAVAAPSGTTGTPTAEPEQAPAATLRALPPESSPASSAKPESSKAESSKAESTSTAPTLKAGNTSDAAAIKPENTPALAPKLLIEIPHRYALGQLRVGKTPPTDAEATVIVLAAAKEWQVARCQIAWYEADKKSGQGVFMVAETIEGATPTILRAENPEDALKLEKSLAYATTVGELASIYLDNEIIADEDFRGKPVMFSSTVSEVAKGAFNRPYVFFPGTDGALTGLTCYFDAKDPVLRKIRKGSQVTVRGTIKGFLMQDVILDPCSVLTLQKQ